MKLSQNTKLAIYNKIVASLNVKGFGTIAKELQEKIDDVQPKWFVEFYKSTLKICSKQGLSFTTYKTDTIGSGQYYHFWVEYEFFDAQECKQLFLLARQEVEQIKEDLKKLKESILAVNTDKAFLVVFPQWEQQLNESLPTRKVNMPAIAMDVSYLDKYKKQGV
nr:MAG TPA: hypothetical protein [Caudoviricetes sp.]